MDNEHAMLGATPIQMRLTRKSRWKTGASLLIALLIFLFVEGSARANTYRFSFTASQVLSALQKAEGSSNFDESAYFAIFVQPDPAVVTTYSYAGGISFNAPNNGNLDAWQSNTITDPSSPNLGYSSLSPCTTNCTWVQYSKQSGDSPDGQTSVTVLSQADPAAGGTGDFFLGATYWDNTPAPYGWGATNATITTVYNTKNANPLFQFLVNTPLNLSGSVALQGRASSLRSSSTTTFTTGPFGTKEHDGISFNLNATVTNAVPEPEAVVLTAAGLGFLLISAVLKRRRRAV